jgi:ectoine hydroxylase-related dioxygenase (phytanoyl-CoA dioxygenase family)
VFFNSVYGDNKPIDSSIKVIGRQTPAAGDFLVFDGSLCHASCNPVNSDKRAVINFTLLKDEA